MNEWAIEKVTAQKKSVKERVQYKNDTNRHTGFYVYIYYLNFW